MPANDSSAIREQGHVALYAAAIEQAWLDTRRPVVSGSKSTSSTVTAKERIEARLFFLATEGYWAESRAMLCQAVGLDPDVLRERARMVLA